MVVPGVVGPAEPCHVIVQPPDWGPMSSAPEPASSTSSPVASGSRPAVVLSSTADFPTASRASARSCVGAQLGVVLGRHRVLEQAQLELDA